ncbi:MAG TPA: hypothetical protein DCM87_15830, partial [Planctomycetes bacterium]|nr:hypothetical protein [Planctomycetota bacterium]
SVSAAESALTVVFSEALDAATAADAGNYAVREGVSVYGASLDGTGMVVLLQTSAHADGAYTLVVSGVADLAGNAITNQAVGYSYTSVPTTGLMAYWRLDELSGLTAADASGNGNTGTLVNGPVWTGTDGLSFAGNGA